MHINISNLYKKYEKSTIYTLEDINIDISKGERIVVLGSSGSGKSTLIRCINRLIDSTDGTIYYKGKNVTNIKGKDIRFYRKKFGMIFQNYNLIDRLDVLTNVLVGRFGDKSFLQVLKKEFTQEEIELAKSALSTVGLDDLYNRRISKLSGGQQQRVGIARTLVQQPEVILGDEPVSSLDPISTTNIMSLLKQINIEKNITMIINLHNVDIAKEFATRIVGINQGKIVFDDRPEFLDKKEVVRIYHGIENELSVI
ncbi:phosphonate ABC transporter ATP-binding protein [Tepidibacter aestuarii]|uniref:phosphonate ABC transporter ATP-binding protein n=1 Tax=Tepidibacter aestuarii TaxID=2925782 RepID=UPI0020BFA003|nr:phosphonate ABC transporter ATP-binding protein [Tepidibacter aestuarii]CAH2214515.1 phosphonate/phosphate ABC transporter ATP binding subunit [Tepidibacter aestuarii]